MRTNIALFAVIPAILLAAACGSVSAASPTGPSPVTATTPAAVQDYPSLTGRWRPSGRIEFRNLSTGNVLSWNCGTGSLTVTAQDGRGFTATFGTQGSGWNTDRYCTASGTFTGEIATPDGSIASARLDSGNWPRPAVNPSCEFLSRGDGIWRGTATAAEIRLQATDSLRCAVNVDGGTTGMPMADFERTVTLTFRPW